MNRFLWLVRRELWESRAAWVVPASLAAIIIGGLLIGSLVHGALMVDFDHGPSLAEIEAKLTPARIEALASLARGVIAVLFLIAALFTQFFYTLDALYSERRDRSILFWKSLPVSDAATVLAKLSVAALAIPLAAAACALVTQLAVFAILSVKLAAIAPLAGHFWSPGGWAGSLLVLLYLLLAGTLWYLPLLGWLLLVSAWARRSPLMWAALAPCALALAEYIVLHTGRVWQVITARAGFSAFVSRAFDGLRGSRMVIFDSGPQDVALSGASSLVDLMRPAQFFASPEVWVGVAAGIGLIAATIWMRRYSDASN